MKYLIFSAILLATLTLCREKTELMSPKQKETGTIICSMDMTKAPKEVNSIKGFLSRSEEDTIFFDFVLENDSACTIVENIIIGSWMLQVYAYDISNNPIYYGNKTVSVQPNCTTPVVLFLNPISRSLEITVKWNKHSQSDLIAFFPFNGDAKEKSGHNNHGVVHGATLTTDRFGQPESAYYFDGIDDFIDVGNKPILKVKPPVTITAWIKYMGKDCKILKTSFHKARYFGIMININPHTRRLNLNYGDGGVISPMSRRTKAIEAPMSDNWFHFAGIIRDSLDMDIYINSENIIGDYSGAGGPVQYADTPLIIGKVDTDHTGPSGFMHGKRDDIRIYDCALTEEEIYQIYSSDRL